MCQSIELNRFVRESDIASYSVPNWAVRCEPVPLFDVEEDVDVPTGMTLHACHGSHSFWLMPSSSKVCPSCGDALPARDEEVHVGRYEI